MTTKGWQLLCQWKDSSTNWVALKDMKNSYPVQIADYAVANCIDDEPAFAWWMSNVVKKHEQILSKSRLSIGSTLTNLASTFLKLLLKCKQLIKKMGSPCGGMLS